MLAPFYDNIRAFAGLLQFTSSIILPSIELSILVLESYSTAIGTRLLMILKD